MAGSRKALVLLVGLLLTSSFVSAHLGHAHGDGEDAAAETTPVATAGTDGTLAANTTASSTAAQASIREIELHSGKLISNKVGSLVVAFAVPFLACLLTFFNRASHEVTTYGNLFAAGLFLTVALLHVLDDSTEGLRGLGVKDYPWSYLLVVMGYFLTMICDLVVHAILKSKDAKAKAQAEAKNADLDKSFHSVPAEAAKPSCCQARLGTADEESALRNATTVSCCCSGNCKCAPGSCQCPQEVRGFARPRVGEDTGAAQGILGDAITAKHHEGSHDLSQLASTDVFLLALALCFHAVFDGLAIGLSSTSKDVWKTTSTIMLYKVFEGLALGASLMMQNPRRSFPSLLPCAAGFALAAPVGIAIGIVLDSAAPTRTALWADAIGSGIACGVFIYVALTHIIGTSFKESCQDKWWTPFAKWAACALGVTTVALIQLKKD